MLHTIFQAVFLNEIEMDRPVWQFQPELTEPKVKWLSDRVGSTGVENLVFLYSQSLKSKVKCDQVELHTCIRPRMRLSIGARSADITCIIVYCYVSQWLSSSGADPDIWKGGLGKICDNLVRESANFMHFGTNIPKVFKLAANTAFLTSRRIRLCS